jgi:hypothetical protein
MTPLRSLPLLLSICWSMAGAAAAQPSATPPSPAPPIAAPGPAIPAPPSPCQACIPSYPSYPALLSLNQRDRELLLRGEVSSGRHIGGAVLAIYLGFGSGQALQGRWSDTGWIFTLGEVASVATILAQVPALADFCSVAESDRFPADAQCEARRRHAVRWALAGLATYTGFHIWEIADAVTGPQRDNRRVRALRQQAGYAPRWGQATPYLSPTLDGGAMAGFSSRF